MGERHTSLLGEEPEHTWIVTFCGPCLGLRSTDGSGARPDCSVFDRFREGLAQPIRRSASPRLLEPINRCLTSTRLQNHMLTQHVMESQKHQSPNHNYFRNHWRALKMERVGGIHNSQHSGMHALIGPSANNHACVLHSIWTFA